MTTAPRTIFDPLTDHGNVVLDLVRLECAGIGMEPPFVVCCVSPEGSTVTVRLALQGDPEIISGKQTTEPMSVIVVDQQNQAALFTKAPSTSAVRLMRYCVTHEKGEFDAERDFGRSPVQ